MENVRRLRSIYTDLCDLATRLSRENTVAAAVLSTACGKLGVEIAKIHDAESPEVGRKAYIAARSELDVAKQGLFNSATRVDKAISEFADVISRNTPTTSSKPAEPGLYLLFPPLPDDFELMPIPAPGTPNLLVDPCDYDDYLVLHPEKHTWTRPERDKAYSIAARRKETLASWANKNPPHQALLAMRSDSEYKLITELTYTGHGMWIVFGSDMRLKLGSPPAQLYAQSKKLSISKDANGNYAWVST